MASLAPTDGTAVSEPDEMEQSLEEELESIQNEQSIQVIPDPPPVAPSSQEVPPVAEPEQHKETAAANKLDDPQVRYNEHIKKCLPKCTKKQL